MVERNTKHGLISWNSCLLEKFPHFQMPVPGIAREPAAVTQLLLAQCLRQRGWITGTWVTLIKDSCPERAVLSLSPGSIQRELSLPRQCVTTCVHNRAGNSTHCPVHQPRVPLVVALPHTSCAVLDPLPSHLNSQPFPISRE